MNLGGPDSLAAVEPFLFNLFKRSGDHPAARAAAVAAGVARSRADAPGPRARSTPSSAARRRCSPIPRRRRGRWKTRSGIGTAALSRCATGIRPAPKRRARSPNGRRTRSSACRSIRNSRRRRRPRRLPIGGARRPGRLSPSRPGAFAAIRSTSGFIAAVAGLIRPVLDAAAAGSGRTAAPAADARMACRKGSCRPAILIRAQVELTARAIVGALARPGLDWRVCYQSRVGPLEWIGPATDAEIRRAGADGVPLVVAPISFVSEHSETLVELDLDYRRIAEESGVPAYHRVRDGRRRPRFIAALAALVRDAGPRDALDGCPARRRSLRTGRSTALERLARRRLSVDQIGPYRRGHRLDGGAALSAAAVRLSRDGAGWARTGRQIFKIMERRLLHGIMTPAMLATLVFGLLLAGTPGCGRLASGLDLGKARSGRGADSSSMARWHVGAGLRRRPKPAFAAIFSHCQRVADPGADRHRGSRRGQAVLSCCRFFQDFGGS